MPTPIDDEGIAQQIGDLTTAVEGVHETLRLENEKRDKRIRTNQWAIGLAMVVGAVGIGVGVWGRYEVNQTRNERDASRVASCEQYNDQQEQGIAAEIEQSHDFIDTITAGRADLEDEKQAYNDRHDALIRRGHPKRDCSPEGIAKYLERQASKD